MDDVELARMLAKCHGCNSVFYFSAQLQPAGASPSTGDLEMSTEGLAMERRRPKVPRPESITIRHPAGNPAVESTTATSYRTKNDPAPARLELVLRGSPSSEADDPRIVAVPMVVGVLVLGIGVLVEEVLVAFILGSFLVTVIFFAMREHNETIIRVGDGVLSVTHPWEGSSTISLELLAQLYCEEARGYKGTVSYHLNAIVSDGSKLNLLSGRSADEVLFIEQEVEAALGMMDAPVGDEYRR